MTPLTEGQRKLAGDNIRLAYKAANDFKKIFRSMDIEDLESLCMGGLCYAARRYDATRGCKFSRFAWRRMLGAVKNSFADDHLVRVPRNHFWGADATPGRSELTDLEGRDVAPDEAAMARERADRLSAMLDRLGPRQADVIRCTVLGEEDAASYAARAGITSRRVWMAQGEAVRRLREMMVL